MGEGGNGLLRTAAGGGKGGGGGLSSSTGGGGGSGGRERPVGPLAKEPVLLVSESRPRAILRVSTK